MTTGFYVTMKRGARTAWLFGPIADHAVAVMLVPYVRQRAETVDPFTHFDSFGTSSITSEKELPLGVFNR